MVQGVAANGQGAQTGLDECIRAVTVVISSLQASRASESLVVEIKPCSEMRRRVSDERLTSCHLVGLTGSLEPPL